MAYPIGTEGQPWGETEKAQWLSQQSVKRSYQSLVVTQIEALGQRAEFTVVQYGALSYDEQKYPLFAIQLSAPNPKLPTVLITGGVHGYETSGVMGALRFCQEQMLPYANHFNFVVFPCVSPWGFETINRWNPDAMDPNRSFFATNRTSLESDDECEVTVEESGFLQSYLHQLKIPFLAHFDLHETTDTDNSEFRPALAARDAIPQKSWNIPDGFYCVADTLRPEPRFQQGIIAAVAKVTHIAPADDNGELIGSKMTQLGVIEYDTKKLGLCAGTTDAQFVTTTEVYPDSPLVDEENCINAQVAAIVGGLEYLLTRS